MLYTNKYNFLIPLLFCVFVIHSSKAQPTRIREISKKTHESLKGIHKLRFLTSTTKKPFSSRDTINLKAYGEFQLNNNHPTSYKIISKWDKKYTIDASDDSYTSKVKFNIDSLDIKTKIEYSKITDFDLENYQTLNIKNEILFKHNLNIFFSKKNVFNYYRKFYSTWLVSGVSIEENTFKNTHVYVLTIKNYSNKKNNKINNYIINYYIRKDNFLPIAYSFYGEFEGMKETIFTEIEYLEINPNITKEYFKIDPTIKEVIPREYYEEAIKYNL